MNPDAPGAALYQKMLDSGAPPEQADAWRQTLTQRMLQSGAPPKDVDTYWGTADPNMSNVEAQVKANIAQLTPEEHAKIAENPLEMIEAGLQSSVTGLALRGKNPTLVPPEHAGMMSSILSGAGQFVGDIPATVAGFLAGGAGGAAVSAETGPGAAIGALVGAGAGSAALPEAMRGVLMDQYAHPNGAKSWQEVWTHTANIIWNTTKAAIAGGIAAPIGGMVGGKLLASGGSKAAATLADLGTQAATATTVGAGLDGHVPDAQDFVTGAALAIGFHGAGAIIGATQRFVASDATKLVAENARDIYRDNGIPPQQLAVPATKNVVLNSEVLAPHAADGTRVTPMLDAMRPPEPDRPVKPEAGSAYPPSAEELNKLQTEGLNTTSERNTRSLEIQGEEELSDLGEFADHYVEQATRALDPQTHPLLPPPENPTDFQKTIEHLDPETGERVLWSESRQQWLTSMALSPSDWAHINSLIEPKVGEAATEFTYWWHGTAKSEARLDPQSTWHSVKAVWIASHMSTSRMFASVSGTLHRIAIAPGKYFDFRDPEQLAEFEKFVTDYWTKYYQEFSSDPKIVSKLADLGIETDMSHMKLGHYSTMELNHVQKFFRDNGYEGYFEREFSYSSVNLAVYKAEKILKMEGSTPVQQEIARTTDTGRVSGPTKEDQLARMRQLRAAAEKYQNAGQLLAAYEHGHRPPPDMTEGMYNYLQKGGAPPSPPPPRLPGGEVPPPGDDPLRRAYLRSQINEMIAPGQPGPGLWQRFTKFFSGFQSELAAGDRLDRRLQTTDPRQMNIANMMRQTYGSAGRAGQFAEVGTLKWGVDARGDLTVLPASDDSFLKALQQVKADGGNEADFQRYRLAKRTIELASRGINSGLDVNVASEFLAGENLDRLYARGEATWQRVKNAAIDYAHQSGVFSEAQINAMKELNEHHIVLRRLMDPNYDPPSATRGFGWRKSIKKIEGSERQIVDPLTAEIDNLHTMIAMADMNAARGNIIGLIESKNPKVTDAIRLEHMQALDLDTSEHLRQTVLDEEGKPLPRTTLDAAAPFLASRSDRLGRNDFIYYRNGQAEVWRAHDQDLADLMRTSTALELPGVMKLAQGIANFARLGITGSLDFPLRSIFHGQIAASALSEHSALPYHDIIKGFMHAWNKDEAYQRWVANGGANVALTDIRGMMTKNLDRVWDEDTGSAMAVWNAVRHPLDALRAGYHMIDAASRIGYMERVENKGLSTLKAATLSRTAYLDHAEGRANSWLREFARTVPFMEIGFKDIEQVLTALRDRPFGTLLKAGAYITAPTIINYAVNWLMDQDLPPGQRYSELPRWERDMYWVLPPVNGVRLKIKRPYVVGFMFGTMPERFMDEVAGQPGAKDFFSALAAQALPPVIPTIISPMVEQWANKSFFTGQPLIKGSLEKASGYMQYRPDTTETAKAISRWLGPVGIGGPDWSPIILQNYVQQWAGSLPMNILRALEAPFKPPGRPWEVADIPFVGAFFARQPAASTASVENFYDDYSRVQAGVTDLQLAIKRGNQQEIQEALQQDAALKGLSTFQTAESRLSAVITAIDQSNMTKDEKRKRIDQLTDAMVRIAQGGSKIIEQYEAQRK